MFTTKFSGEIFTEQLVIFSHVTQKPSGKALQGRQRVRLSFSIPSFNNEAWYPAIQKCNLVNKSLLQEIFGDSFTRTFAFTFFDQIFEDSNCPCCASLRVDTPFSPHCFFHLAVRAGNAETIIAFLMKREFLGRSHGAHDRSSSLGSLGHGHEFIHLHSFSNPRICTNREVQCKRKPL